MADLPNVHSALSEERGFPGGWEEREGYDAFPGATYCRWDGSVDPVTFLALLESDLPGANPLLTRLEVADWKYGWPHKVYLDLRNPRPDAITYLGGRSGGAPDADPPGPGYVRKADLTKEQVAILKRDGAWLPSDEDDNGTHWYLFGTRETIRQKFYTEHLLDLPEFTEAMADLIERRTGVRFRIKDGKLGWRGIPSGRI